MGTLYCALENGADLYVNERWKIRHYRARSTEERRRITEKEKKECQIPNFYFAGCRDVIQGGCLGCSNTPLTGSKLIK